MLECQPSMLAVLNSNLSIIKAELRTQLQLARRGKLNFCIVLFMSAVENRLIRDRTEPVPSRDLGIDLGQGSFMAWGWGSFRDYKNIKRVVIWH